MINKPPPSLNTPKLHPRHSSPRDPPGTSTDFTTHENLCVPVIVVVVCAQTDDFQVPFRPSSGLLSHRIDETALAGDAFHSPRKGLRGAAERGGEDVPDTASRSHGRS